MSDLNIQTLLLPGHLALTVLVVSLIFAVGWFMYPFMFDRGLKRAMSNGFGKLMSDRMELAVKNGNEKQSELQNVALASAVQLFDSKIAATITKHEEVEELRLRVALHEVKQEVKKEEHVCADKVIGRLDAHDLRLTEVEARLTTLLGHT